MKCDAQRPPLPFAYEKIDVKVSVGNVPIHHWYETDILREGLPGWMAVKIRRLTTGRLLKVLDLGPR